MENKFKHKRKSKGFTQEELAKKSGVSRGTILALESEKSGVVTKTSTLIKLATALDSTVADIFFE